MSDSVTGLPSTTAVTTGEKPVKVKRSSRNLRKVIAMLQEIERGILNIIVPSGRVIRYEGTERGPEATLVVKDVVAADHILRRGKVGAAESYEFYDWDSPDLVTLLEVFALNREKFSPLFEGNLIYRMRAGLTRQLHGSGMKGRARRFAAHYNLPNRFFECWLDPEMVYSAANYGLGSDLASAQKAKLNRICEQLGLKPGMKLLELNCGWGSLAVMAARDYGCEVTALTLSEAQIELCRKRAHGHRQDDKVDFRLQDFSEVEGNFDRIISIEPFGMMTEEDWPRFFATINSRLADGGLAYVETSTIRDELFESYRENTDPVREFIFPGALLPSPSALDKALRDNGLDEAGIPDVGGNYIPTLKIWQRRFQTMWPEIMMLGFDNEFKRRWELFLAYAEAAYRTHDVGLREMLLAKRQD
jgi:cyclopropane-fatty-acyl-phospholipid synthase